MSVLIKGMDMPQNCYECKLEAYNICLVKDHETESIGRPVWCPLIELPPHGRLIDADNLLSVLDILCDKGGDIRYWEQLAWIIKDCPTIIEAEVDDERFNQQTGGY